MLKYYKLDESFDTSWIVENNINYAIQNKSFNSNRTYFTNRLRAVLSLPTHIIKIIKKKLENCFDWPNFQ